MSLNQKHLPFFIAVLLAMGIFIGSKLNAQLEEQTQLFLADKTRNRLVKNTLEVSSIFKWYKEDFEKFKEGLRNLKMPKPISLPQLFNQ